MTEYVCKLGTPSGEIIEAVYTATSAEELRKDFERKEYLVYSLRPRNLLMGLLRPTSKGRGRVSMADFLIFNQELAALVHAGLPIVSCLDIIIERRKNPVFRKALRDVRDQVRSGAALSEAFGSQGDLFPSIYASTLASGERSGEIESVVRRYVTYVKKTLAIRKKVVTSMIYPCFLIVFAALVLSVFIGYVVPKFQEFLVGFGSDLPLLTRIVISSTLFIRDHFWMLLVLLVGAWVALVALGRSEAGRVKLDHLKLRLPLIGSVLHKFSITNLCRTLGALLSGGIPLVQALTTSGQAMSNLAFRSAINTAVIRVREGHPLWESLEQTGLMTDLAVEMIKVGEATGSLDNMLINVAEFYDEEIDNDLTTLVAIIEPAMLIIMAVVVVFIVLALYLPLFTSYSVV
ncbi:MAG: type II secretion system F family protein [Acidobacteriota bacterium]